MAFTPGSIVNKYTQGAQTNKTTGGFVPGSIVSKYNGHNAAVEEKKPTTIQDWTGINPNTYVQESVEQVKQGPVNWVKNAIGAGYEAFVGTFKNVWEKNKNVLMGGQEPVAERAADYLYALGADVGVIFTPITTVFAAASKVPGLKQAADLFNVPFAFTGKIGSSTFGKFVDYLPVSQENKDILKPAFEEVGTLVGQLTLGAKVMSKVMGGKKIDKVGLKEDIASSKKYAEESRKVVEQNHPEVVNPIVESPLAQEAPGTKVYRGGSEIIDKTKIGKEGVSVSTDKTTAENFVSPENGVVSENTISTNAKILKEKNIPAKLQNDYMEKAKELANPNNFSKQLQKEVLDKQQAIVDYAKKNGYDAVEFPFEKEIRVINPDVLQAVKTAPEVKIPVVDQVKVKADIEVLKADPIFEKGNHAEMARVFNETFNMSPEKALNIALGKEEAPKGGTQTSFAKLYSDPKTNPNITTEQFSRILNGEEGKAFAPSKAGQELESAKMGGGDDLLKALSEINKDRQKASGNKPISQMKVVDIIKKLSC